MITNLWRYSHFLLAVSSFLFLILAAVTGIILSTQPLVERSQPESFGNLQKVRLASFIPTIKENYEEVLSVVVTENKALIASVFSMDDEQNGDLFIDPLTTKKIAKAAGTENEFYQTVTTLHRSLFLHKTGRIIMGVTSFLLFIMAITGAMLIAKQTNGFRHFFNPIIKQTAPQFYHTITGRLMLIPIIIISLTGAYLTLVELDFIEKKETKRISIEPKQTDTLAIADFSIFQRTTLADIKKLEFPFSEDEEDVFILQLKNEEVEIHQYTGEIISRKQGTEQLKNLSLSLHTGRNSLIWAVILGLASLNILYFIYSGAQISWKRIKTKTKNKYSAKESEIIILHGSENGNTKKKAALVWQQLLQNDQKVFIDELNNIQVYPQAKQLLILTATYGDGEPPSNASKFLTKLNAIQQKGVIHTQVIGFGSHAYPKFCQFAKDAFAALQQHENYATVSQPKLIHNQNYTSFKLAIEQWAKTNQFAIDLPHSLTTKDVQTNSFTVVGRNEVDDSFSTVFTLELEPKKTVHYQSGDLLALTPQADPVERFYSIGLSESGNILLSIKLHEMGVCSQWLYQLTVGDKLAGRVEINKDFHLPKRRPVVLIANGTGIAPFLGKILQNKNQEKHLYFGGRNQHSFQLYQPIFEQAKAQKSLTSLQFAMSRVEHEPSYVQELIIEDADHISQILIKKKGTVMICGSLAMQAGVLETLDKILTPHGKSVSLYIARKKILMDCY